MKQDEKLRPTQRYGGSLIVLINKMSKDGYRNLIPRYVFLPLVAVGEVRLDPSPYDGFLLET